MKLAAKPNYTFTDNELDKIVEVLQQLSHDIQKVGGITFNEALAKISRKKV